LSNNNRLKDFEETLNGYNKEVESFKKREVASPDEMQKNVDKLNELSRLLDEASQELEVILRLMLMRKQHDAYSRTSDSPSRF